MDMDISLDMELPSFPVMDIDTDMELPSVPVMDIDTGKDMDKDLIVSNEQLEGNQNDGFDGHDVSSVPGYVTTFDQLFDWAVTDGV